ncbi:MAG: ferrous iron transport protein B [Clostridiales bacterium]|nr:ferrous iron transport protein B [Clostridiales bacterium]
MELKIALAGNPNSGKTTVFNELTGSTQYVGNWPGVTVEKKEGRLKGYNDVGIIDLPGIYSLSPYSLEEVIARKYIMDEKPNVIINIVDASNIERNLYLTTQLIETGIPVVIAMNMMDIVNKNGTIIDADKLSASLGCPVLEISALKGDGIKELAQIAIKTAKQQQEFKPLNLFDNEVEQRLQKIKGIVKKDKADFKYDLGWLVIKLFEKDDKVLKSTNLSDKSFKAIDDIIHQYEVIADDDTESIIITQRYNYIEKLMSKYVKKKTNVKLNTSDNIDRVLTNRWLALPIFFGIMWFIYWVSISTLGDYFIGWVESLFEWISGGVETVLVNAGTVDWLQSLILDGIIGGVGGVLVFVPQLMILFFFISILEDCGYMARVAFIMDRIFRKFGLSGKSFIPMLIGTGCSIPGIMASRTIENDKDRKMTIMLTPFIPCGAKLPVFAMFIAMLFSQQTWVGPLMYFMGMAMVIISGVILKRTKLFKGDPAPFVMELPQYRMPRFKGVLIHMWERVKSFMIKAGTIILVAAVGIWFLQSFSFSFKFLGGENIENSMLAGVGNVFRYLFIPLGFGDSWAGGVATITGLIAKEVVVSTFAIIGTSTNVLFSQVSAFSFMVFTLFAAPCFAAIGAMKREFGSWRWTFIAVGYQTGIAYVFAMIINLAGGLIFKNTSAVTPVVLDPSAMEGASEGSVISGDIVLIIFGVLLTIAIITGIVNAINDAQYRRNINNKKGKMIA